jgi:hypothetical protein
MNNNQNNAPMYGEESHLEIKVNHDDYLDYSTMPPEPPPFVDDFHVDNSVTKSQKKPSHNGFSFSNGDYLADNAPAPFYLINGILEADSHGVIGGASMAFKTFVALRMVHSICTGRYFMGREVYATGKVIYVCGEGQGALSRRIKALKIVDGGFNDNLIVISEPVKIDNETDMARLKQMIADINPALVVFDTFASLVSETDENAPSAVGKALRLIKETCRNGNTSSLIVHHHGKDANKGLRGASNFTNDVDFSLELTRNVDSMMATLSCKKMKDGENFDDLHMTAHVVELGLIRQDGKETTSLVMKKADYAPAKKSANKLSANSERALSKLRDVINNAEITPLPDVVKELFKDHMEQAPNKVVMFDQWRDVAVNSISVNSDPNAPKKFNAAKRKAWLDSKNQLQNYGFIGVEGDYIWLIDKFNQSVTSVT